MSGASFSHEATPTMHRSRTKLVNPEVHVSDAPFAFLNEKVVKYSNTIKVQKAEAKSHWPGFLPLVLYKLGQKLILINYGLKVGGHTLPLSRMAQENAPYAMRSNTRRLRFAMLPEHSLLAHVYT